MSDKPISSIRLVAWKIAEEFKTLDAEVLGPAMDLDNQEEKWWEDEEVKPTYKVGIAAHVAENLIWWPLSREDKEEACKLFKKGGVEECQKKFPFHKAYFKKPWGLAEPSDPIKDLGGVITRTLHDRALIVAFLLGLDAIYKGETCAQELHKLAKDAAKEASKSDDDWRKFKARAKEVVRQLPLDPALYVAPQD